MNGNSSQLWIVSINLNLSLPQWVLMRCCVPSDVAHIEHFLKRDVPSSFFRLCAYFRPMVYQFSTYSVPFFDLFDFECFQQSTISRSWQHCSRPHEKAGSLLWEDNLETAIILTRVHQPEAIQCIRIPSQANEFLWMKNKTIIIVHEISSARSLGTSHFFTTQNMTRREG